jgi:hypothetical protein
MVRQNLDTAPAANAMIRRMRRDRVLASLFPALAGGVILLWGLLSRGSSSSNFLVFLGGIFSAYGLLSLARASTSPVPGQIEKGLQPPDRADSATTREGDDRGDD